jgi:hypothetical protein
MGASKTESCPNIQFGEVFARAEIGCSNLTRLQHFDDFLNCYPCSLDEAPVYAAVACKEINDLSMDGQRMAK